MAGDRLGELARHRAELPQRIILQYQRDAEGGQDRRQRIAADQGPQRDHIDRRAEQADQDVAEISANQKLPVTARVKTPT